MKKVKGRPPDGVRKECTMIHRMLSDFCFSDTYGRQMRFVAGPRQSGKTTIAKEFLEKAGCSKLYYNWDMRAVKKRYRAENLFFQSDALDVQKKTEYFWVAHDEIHKYPKWKDLLKDFFDSSEDEFRFLITGSARLDLFRKSGDSLAGRYFLFRLFPLSLTELTKSTDKILNSSHIAKNFVEERIFSTKYNQELLIDLLSMSGFPEPFLRGTKIFYRKWHNAYIDRLVREDLRDLTRIRELENISALIEILPAKVGSPLSINSLREDIEVNFASIKNYLKALEIVYAIFFIPPYSKKIARAIKKEPKMYFYDWTTISDPAKRFENYIAVELKILTSTWVDMGKGDFQLNYIRTKDGKETDFLIVKDNQPWLLLEAKYSQQIIEKHHYAHAEKLGNIPFVQFVFQPNITIKNKDFYQISASRFFS